MTISEILQYCMNKPGAEQSVHSDWKATQIKVGDVLFAMVKEVEGRPAASLKTSPELAELLRSSIMTSGRASISIKRTGAPSIWMARCRLANLLSGGCVLSAGG
jgi:hypothetical protein